ncbi:acyl-CoA dehydrogenase family protein [Bacillus sp. FJAT-50079]|uniref:acyl-CoA dehydrogenase family protein n=1 Tax=Bacillus sp. FJAT-50079 TaxID=2833577 RepID=UPI001BC98F34|nr:acyl-CoA dehydrogenase family protein [Bacillus sp. FJAT-50079]MBS4210616.1 acyl-CoA/acyl-ACP dehydrogenase [Bacillus sp. FJAT-50079]
MIQLFVKTEAQEHWLKALQEKAGAFENKPAEIDELSAFPHKNIQDLIEIGYTSTTLPKTYGGAGFSVYDMILLQETLARFDGATALSTGWNLGVVGEIFEKKQWSNEILNMFASEILNGALVNRAVSEAQTGSPSRGGRPSTTAVKQGNTWVITGRKNFTTMAPALTYFLVSAWIEEMQGIGFFLVHKDAMGLSIDETWDVMSMRGTGSHDLVLQNVTVGESMLVERPGAREKAPLNGWILHIPAVYLGIAQAARDYTIEFANEHAPNSVSGPISQLANVQLLIGEMDLELIKARHLLYSVAEMYDDHSRRGYLTNELSVAKHAVTNAAITIVDKAMRVVGAKSLQRSNPLQRYYRDVRAGLHNPPMDDVTIKQLALTAIKNE